jgi:hypothetical protein
MLLKKKNIPCFVSVLVRIGRACSTVELSCWPEYDSKSGVKRCGFLKCVESLLDENQKVFKSRSEEEGKVYLNTIWAAVLGAFKEEDGVGMLTDIVDPQGFTARTGDDVSDFYPCSETHNSFGHTHSAVAIHFVLFSRILLVRVCSVVSPLYLALFSFFCVADGVSQ